MAMASIVYAQSLTRYLLPHLFRILCPPPFLPLLALHPRPGTAASPPLREDGARLCLAVYRGSSEGGKGRWFGDRPSLKHPKATNTTLQPIPPPPPPAFLQRSLLWRPTVGWSLGNVSPALGPCLQRRCTNRERVLATVQRGRENPVSFKGCPARRRHLVTTERMGRFLCATQPVYVNPHCTQPCVPGP